MSDHGILIGYIFFVIGVGEGYILYRYIEADHPGYIIFNNVLNLISAIFAMILFCPNWCVIKNIRTRIGYIILIIQCCSFWCSYMSFTYICNRIEFAPSLPFISTIIHYYLCILFVIYIAIIYGINLLYNLFVLLALIFTVLKLLLLYFINKKLIN